MQLTTKRLELVVLDARQLKLWTENLPLLEAELNCSYQAEPMADFFQEIVRGQLAATEKDPENAAWHSFWFLIRKSDRVVVGSADFKDVPNASGEVEIGYGLSTKFEHQGFMTEAVEAMCVWALAQSGVLTVLAETERDGLASQNVLTRCGFRKFQEEPTCWWSRKKA